VPIRLGHHVPGTLNITWTRRVMKRDRAIERLAPPALRAAEEIARRLMLSSVSQGEIPSKAN
jgi:hypothetical protein